MNKVIMIGNLTRDPELRETPNGTPVCSFAIAVKRDYGEDITDFFNVNVWQNQAQNCNEYLKKGSKVGIVGSIQTRSYEDKDGIKRNVTEIIAREVEFLTPKSIEEQPRVVSVTRPKLTEITQEELPF